MYIQNVVSSDVTDRGQRVESPPLGKLNVKTGPPLNLYFGFTIVLVFSKLFFLHFSNYFPVI